MKRQIDAQAVYRAIMHLAKNIPLVDGDYVVGKDILIDILLQAFFAGYSWPG